MAAVTLSVLSDAELRQIRDTAAALLDRTGLEVHHAGAREALGRLGCAVERTRVRFPAPVVRQALGQAPRQFAIHGRDPARAVAFGTGESRLMMSPGQRYWLDLDTGERRAPTLDDAQAAIRLGDALPNIAVVGALAEPAELAPGGREVRLAAELVKGSGKPGCVFVHSVAAARGVLRVFSAAAGGDAALRERPRTLGFFDPISPLQLPGDGLEIAVAFAQAGQPVIVASMALSSGTAPATLAGTLALVHAEVLAGATALQAMVPGAPVVYGGIPHVLDPRSSQCSFGSPEQGLMALAMVQLARSVALPVYVNTGLTDALALDAQAGFEKGSSQCLAWLAGADLLGHSGICGADQAGSLAWVVADDALAGYLQRVRRGFAVDPESLAADVIRDVGPGGHFLADPHTARHFRQELWQPGPAWSRIDWRAWDQPGRPTFAERAGRHAREILDRHRPAALPARLVHALDDLVARGEPGAVPHPTSPSAFGPNSPP